MTGIKFSGKIHRYMPGGVIELYIYSNLIQNFKRMQRTIYLWHRKNRLVFAYFAVRFSSVFRELSVFLFSVLCTYVLLSELSSFSWNKIFHIFSAAFLRNFPNVLPAWHMPFEHKTYIRYTILNNVMLMLHFSKWKTSITYCNGGKNYDLRSGRASLAFSVIILCLSLSRWN